MINHTKERNVFKLMKKKITSLFLALVLSFSLCIPAFALSNPEIALSDNVKITILQDDSDFRIAQADYENVRFIAIYDKLNNTMSMDRYSLVTGVKEASVVTDLNDSCITTSDGTESIATQGAATASITTGSKSTSSKFSYNYSNSYCILARPRYVGDPESGTYSFMTFEKSTNITYLDNYRAAVNDLYADEQALLANVGVTSFLAGFATSFAIATGGTGFGVSLGAYLSAAGFFGAAIIVSYQIGADQDAALVQYNHVLDDYVSDL